MKIIDTHTHLDHLDHATEAIATAFAQGVESIITVGVDLTANRKNLEIKKNTKNPKIYVALGMHPANIIPEEVNECFQFIRDHIDEAIAIGETGLDYWYKWVKKNPEKKQEQKDIFQKQLELSREFNLPVIIHSRGAWEDCLTMTKAAGIDKAIFHWYSGPIDVLDKILENGYYVSTTPSLAYSPQSREAIAHAPIERILIETDCPVRFKDGDDKYTAEPKDVVKTLKAYSELKQINEEEALTIFNNNARKFFGID